MFNQSKQHQLTNKNENKDPDSMNKYSIKDQEKIYQQKELNQQSNKLECGDRRKNKKKKYKKRKRLKQKIQEQQAKAQLAAIIQEIYFDQITVEQTEETIKICLKLIQNSEKFYQLLDHQIATNIDEIQKRLDQQIINQTQENIQIIDDYCFDEINTICHYYRSIRESSQEIKKIVKLYNQIFNDFEHIAYKSRNYQQLEKQSINYLIGNSEKLKKTIKNIEKRVIGNNIDEQIAELIYLNRFLESQQLEEGQQHEQSTSIEQEQDDKNTHKKRNRKRRKIKNQDFKSQYQNVMNRLDSLFLDDQRHPCCVSQQWLQTLQSDIQNFNKK